VWPRLRYSAVTNSVRVEKCRPLPGAAVVGFGAGQDSPHRPVDQQQAIAGVTGGHAGVQAVQHGRRERLPALGLATSARVAGVGAGQQTGEQLRGVVRAGQLPRRPATRTIVGQVQDPDDLSGIAAHREPGVGADLPAVGPPAGEAVVTGDITNDQRQAAGDDLIAQRPGERHLGTEG
jgi:hypothetical protein